jgi:hypothetical protein
MSGIVPGVGRVQSPDSYRLRPDLCEEWLHPGVTYNPWEDLTWCLCGKVTYPGCTIVWPKADGPGGPLREELETNS